MSPSGTGSSVVRSDAKSTLDSNMSCYQQLTGTPVPPHVPHRSRAEAALELV